MRVDADRSEALSPEQCLALLETAPLGRVVFTDRAMPAIQPVDFVIDGGDVIMCLAPGSRLAGLLPGSIVAFEADGADGASAWTVTIIGNVQLVHEPLRRRPRTSRPGDLLVRIPGGYVRGQRQPEPAVTPEPEVIRLGGFGGP